MRSKRATSKAGLRFEDRGSHALKGVPGEWTLFAVARQDPAFRR